MVFIILQTIYESIQRHYKLIATTLQLSPKISSVEERVIKNVKIRKY